MNDEHETPLTGGWISGAVRVGQTIRKASSDSTPALRSLIGHLRDVGCHVAPDLLGLDEKGREIWDLVEGDVPAHADPSAVTDDALVAVGAMIRRLHDATQAFALPAGITWHTGETAIDADAVVCHQDLAPRNTVFRRGRPVVFIDWDLASPGTRSWDLAHALWQFVPVMRPEATAEMGWREPPDVAARVRQLLVGYGPHRALPERFGEVVVARMQATVNGIAAFIAQGSEAHARLRNEGVVQDIEADIQYARRCSPEVDRGAADVVKTRVGP